MLVQIKLICRIFIYMVRDMTFFSSCMITFGYRLDFVDTTGALISYWTSFLMFISHDPSSRMTKLNYIIKLFFKLMRKNVFSTFIVEH